MADPKRLESSAPLDAVDRDSRAESLLVDGLDRYFSGQYEEAIHLWTRVLFFDRSHARARAYIDRARTALAERHRRMDEMLHRTSDLLETGQTEQARVLLAQATAVGGDDERAAELRLRLERVERARSGYAAHAPFSIVDAVPLGHARSVIRWRKALSAAAVLLAVVAGALAGPAMEGWVSERNAAPTLALPVVETVARLPVLSRSDAALVRARTLYSRGRLAQALQALDRVELRSPEWAVADQLRVEIQQILLASRRGLSSPHAGVDAGRP